MSSNMSLYNLDNIEKSKMHLLMHLGFLNKSLDNVFEDADGTASLHFEVCRS